MHRLLSAAALGLVLTVAGAASPDEPSPEARAYLGFSFGGERLAPRAFHYGLRLDHDSRFVDGRVPPLVRLDFTREGFNAAQINGVYVVRREYRLRQAEEPAPEEAPADAASTPADPATEPPAEPVAEPAVAEAPDAGAEDLEEAAADGTWSGYSTTDWVLLAVGVVGLGLVAGETSSGAGSEDPDPGADPGTDPGAAPSILPTIVAGSQPRGAYDFLPAAQNMSPEYQEWLDGGTGHMGDLGVHE